MSAPTTGVVEILTDRTHTDVSLIVISPGAPVRAVGREIGELPWKLLSHFHRMIDWCIAKQI